MLFVLLQGILLCKVNVHCKQQKGQGALNHICLYSKCRLITMRRWLYTLGNFVITMHICPRKSKQSRRCIHLFRFSWSFALSVERTRSSIREASRYFCTDLMILTATSFPRLLSMALTTLPNVPWPSKAIISSGESQQCFGRNRVLRAYIGPSSPCLPRLCSAHRRHLLVHASYLRSKKGQHFSRQERVKTLTSATCLTWTSGAFMGGCGGGW